MTDPTLVPVNVRACARCGKDHNNVPFRPFVQPVQPTDVEHTHWAECPKYGDPILMRIEQTAEQQDTQDDDTSPLEEVKQAIKTGRVEFTSRVQDAIETMRLGDPDHEPDFTITSVSLTIWGPWEKNGGGIGIDWTTKSAGCGRCDLTIKDGKLTVMSEAMGREFVKSLFDYIVDHTEWDH